MAQCPFSLPVPPSLNVFGLDNAEKKAWFSLDIIALFFYSHFLKNRLGQSSLGLCPKWNTLYFYSVLEIARQKRSISKYH